MIGNDNQNFIIKTHQVYSIFGCIQKNRQPLNCDCRFLYSNYSKSYLTNPKLIVRSLTQSKLKPKTAIGSICDDDCAAVELYGVLDNRQTETRATHSAGATLVDAVESFE